MCLPHLRPLHHGSIIPNSPEEEAIWGKECGPPLAKRNVFTWEIQETVMGSPSYYHSFTWKQSEYA